MNWLVSFIIRCVLKVGGGYLVAKGIANDAQVQEIVGGLATLAGVLWTYLHAQASAQTRAELAAKMMRASPVLAFLLAAGLVALAGCSSESVTVTAADGSVAALHSITPAWPWQDATKAIAKATGNSTTNRATFSMVGLDDTATTTTNSVAAANAVVSAVTSAAIQAAVTLAAKAPASVTPAVTPPAPTNPPLPVVTTNAPAPVTPTP
jgi:hypothetical protein